MTRYVVITDEFAVIQETHEIENVDEALEFPHGIVLSAESEKPEIGWRVDNRVAVAPPVPKTISYRQLALEAKSRGLITGAEALALVTTKTLPTIFRAVIDSIQNSDARIDAEITAAGASELNIDDPLIIAIATVITNGTNVQSFLNSFFRSAAAR